MSDAWDLGGIGFCIIPEFRGDYVCRVPLVAK